MLRITEATYEGPDSDGDFRFEIELELKNTEENAEIEKIKYSSLILNESGLCLTGSSDDEEDIYAEPGETVSFSANTPWLRDPNHSVSSQINVIINAAMLKGDGIQIGSIETPQDDSGWASKDDIIKLGDTIEVMGLRIFRNAPDDDGDVKVDVSCGMRNLTSHFIDEVQIKSLLLNNRGEVIDESDNSQIIPPYQGLYLECGHYMRKGKFRNTSLQISLSYMQAFDHQSVEGAITRK